jgi:hypothetical protein
MIEHYSWCIEVLVQRKEILKRLAVDHCATLVISLVSSIHSVGVDHTPSPFLTLVRYTLFVVIHTLVFFYFFLKEQILLFSYNSCVKPLVIFSTSQNKN